MDLRSSNEKKSNKTKNYINELKLNVNDSVSEFTVQMIDGQKNQSLKHKRQSSPCKLLSNLVCAPA